MEYLHVMGWNLGVILSDVPKSERNRKPTKDHCVVRYPSYGIDDYSKTFCFSKKWWDKHLSESDGKSYLLKNHWWHHFKRLH